MEDNENGRESRFRFFVRGCRFELIEEWNLEGEACIVSSVGGGFIVCFLRVVEWFWKEGWDGEGAGSEVI